LEEFIKIERNIDEIKLMNPLIWAYIGDNVYEIFIRTHLINTTNLKPHKLHIESIKYVKASAQAQILNNIYDDLTEEEKDVVRRGRNAENHHVPKNSNVQEYMYATAFEALIGYLYLSKQNKRLSEILNKSLMYSKSKGEQ
jgi:ribonuclease-3 family protein